VTGRSFRSAGVVIDTVVNGAIVERWEVDDLLGMLQQLGLAPAT
jgi:predicted ester cyclase